MDYLGLYFETGLNIWQVEAERWSIAITGMSESIDNYYNSRDAGITIKKPKPKISLYFARVLQALEERRPTGWITLGHWIMRACDFEEQRKVEREIEKLKRKVIRNWRDPAHDCSLVITPPIVRETAIVLHIFPPQLASKRREIAKRLSEIALEQSKRPRCVVISRSTERRDNEPYASILVAVPQLDGETPGA